MKNEPVKTALSIFEMSTGALIASVDRDGFPNIKAMLKPRENDGLKLFYFTTNTSSMRVKQYGENPKASIYFYDGMRFRGVMLKGNMDVLHDAATKERIWREGDTMYYSKGVADPDYCVLRFTALSGRIYGDFSSQDFDVE